MKGLDVYLSEKIILNESNGNTVLYLHLDNEVLGTYYDGLTVSKVKPCVKKLEADPTFQKEGFTVHINRGEIDIYRDEDKYESDKKSGKPDAFCDLFMDYLADKLYGDMYPDDFLAMVGDAEWYKVNGEFIFCDESDPSLSKYYDNFIVIDAYEI